MDETVLFIFLGICALFIVYALILGIRQETQKKAKKRLFAEKGFAHARIYDLYDGTCSAAFDDRQRRVLILTDKENAVFDYNKIKDFAVSYRQKDFTDKHVFRDIFIGSVLAGGAGALVGGMRSEKEYGQKISRITIEVKAEPDNFVHVLYDGKGQTSLDTTSRTDKTLIDNYGEFIDNLTEEFQRILNK